MWLKFLEGTHLSVCNRPLIDIDAQVEAVKLNFFTDATVNPDLGAGGIFWKNVVLPAMGQGIQYKI